MRYVLEGEWTGYNSGQRRVVHREVIQESQKARIARLNILHAIRYTDGTSLILTLRPLSMREKVTAINGYGSLIRQAEYYNRREVSVMEMHDD